MQVTGIVQPTHASGLYLVLFFEASARPPVAMCAETSSWDAERAVNEFRSIAPGDYRVMRRSHAVTLYGESLVTPAC